MKKFSIIVLFLALSTSVFAQITVIGGLTSSAGNFSDAVKTENFTQFHAGLGYNIKLPAGFSLLPALEYNVRGSYISGEGLNLKSKNGYLELPVQLKWGFGLIPGFLGLFAVGEPFVSYALHTHVSERNSNDWQKNELDKSNRFHYGVGLGGGVELFGHVQLSVRYFWNFAASEFYFNNITYRIGNGNASGLKFSAAIVF